MNRNILIAYFLAAMKNSWFWLGVWVLYYLRFTDYAGIGIIETVMIVTTSAGEIPSGAIADLFGKKKTLFLSFLFEVIGGFIMAFSQNFQQLVFSVFVMCLGGAMYSGTLEALVYDSLKQVKKEFFFDKAIANISSISLFAMATFSIIGGFMYAANPRLPFIANGFGYLLGLIACLFLIEPKIDTVKFSLKNYLIQTKQGFNRLFILTNRLLIIKLLFIGGALVILNEMLNSILLVEFGYTDKQMGIIFALIYLLSAVSSQLSPIFNKKLGVNNSIYLLSTLTVVFLISMPFVGIFIGGAMVLFIENIVPIINNLSSVAINRLVESKYRATTISTFNMIKNLPYVLSAFLIGSLMDIISAKTFALYLGLALLLIILFQKLLLDKKRSML